jgi:ribosomal protein S18 acetylase RimI-like enzyme
LTDVEVREARIGEETAILDLWRAAEAEPSVTDDAATIRRLIERSPESMLVALRKGTIIGSLIATWDGWRGNFYRLATLPSERRKGIASRLVAEGERRFREQGCARITALVMHEHEDAVGFWRAVGFEHDERIDRHVRTLEEQP